MKRHRKKRQPKRVLQRVPRSLIKDMVEATKLVKAFIELHKQKRKHPDYISGTTSSPEIILDRNHTARIVPESEILKTYRG